MPNNTPKGDRMVIALVGRRNVGKSSLMNALIGQNIAIVADCPGTTTDPVAKHYELLPLGPVTFYDTAGLDDPGKLGALRVKASHQVLYRTDIALLVVGEEGVGEPELAILDKLWKMEIPVLVVFNKTDLVPPSEESLTYCRSLRLSYLEVCALNGRGMAALKRSLVEAAPREFREEPVLVGDLVSEGDTVLCVVPVDLGAPKGRLILPQVQVLRDVLDNDALGMVVKERELTEALDQLKKDPALVVTDSQVVLKVVADVPEHIPLTTFSTLFARLKGDLRIFLQGAKAIDGLKDGDKVLMCEACSHHSVADDIGRVKIPRWLTLYTGKRLEFTMYSGHDFPEDFEEFALAVHCGGCMINRREMLHRMRECHLRGVPITNYGVAISKVQGVLDRISSVFKIH
ncbi:[FeFe] hydrogenase H-cluster maturation GTPase HydF [Pseudodesulfovibrio sediminis]|uniref:[FeFe] hydrogenase H-cluster maturation GTPase HydF n=1 Tax=Pseudodesulfovibrio sediminis TaxID=2810563 RepID=A0ABM9SDQ3_9BACT|nr:[FeFe] hydrogenase H-cluster maturation GTPase HydF [Pseudodesulfovibrio sediminis]BCS88148.1 [FeFe] hydrogenase H-cluster maturation GTPase HydF [Pseudodesulfovibrio sediminis]